MFRPILFIIRGLNLLMKIVVLPFCSFNIWSVVPPTRLCIPLYPFRFRFIIHCHRIIQRYVVCWFEFLSALAANKIIVWNALSCSPQEFRLRFGETYCSHLQCGKVSQVRSWRKLERAAQNKKLGSDTDQEGTQKERQLLTASLNKVWIIYNTWRHTPGDCNQYWSPREHQISYSKCACVLYVPVSLQALTGITFSNTLLSS